VKTSSAKAKGRRLQNDVAFRIATQFELQPGDVKPAVMGESGEDIHLSPAARKVFPFSVECKNQERLNIWDALEQTQKNAGVHHPLLIFKRNRSTTYAAMPLAVLLQILK
jgi:hypothetical protein